MMKGFKRDRNSTNNYNIILHCDDDSLLNQFAKLISGNEEIDLINFNETNFGYEFASRRNLFKLIRYTTRESISDITFSVFISIFNENISNCKIQNIDSIYQSNHDLLEDKYLIIRFSPNINDNENNINNIEIELNAIRSFTTSNNLPLIDSTNLTQDELMSEIFHIFRSTFLL